MCCNFKALPAAKYKGVLAPPCRFVRDTGIYFSGVGFGFIFFPFWFIFLVNLRHEITDGLREWPWSMQEEYLLTFSPWKIKGLGCNQIQISTFHVSAVRSRLVGRWGWQGGRLKVGSLSEPGFLEPPAWLMLSQQPGEPGAADLYIQPWAWGWSAPSGWFFFS